MSFSDDVNKFTKKTKTQGGNNVRKFVLKVAESLILKTPVGDPSRWKTKYKPLGYAGGTARANWQHGFHSFPLSFNDVQDKSGSRTLDAIRRNVFVAEPFQVHYIANNTPYIQRLEDGHSGQAPNGMLKTTLLEFRQFV